MLFTSMTMLLGEISIHHLKFVPSELWNAPFECEEPHFYRVEIIGAVKSSPIFSVRPSCFSGFFWGV